MDSENRGAFVSRIGCLLAAAGSAIGLGNIWRFSTQAGQNGGSAFLLVYLLIILVFGLPLLISEFVIGRRARVNVAHAYTRLAPGSKWYIVGYASSIVAYVIFCYYAVIVGWVLFYLWKSVSGDLMHLSELFHSGGGSVYKEHFVNFIKDPWQPVFFLFLTVAIIHLVIVYGVEKGIERTSKYLVPTLFIIMVIMAVAAAFMPGAADGYRFLFDFRGASVDAGVCLSALGQCFYSFSIGMGLVTYASYFTRDANLVKTAVSVAFLDTLVAVVAGMIIFPAVFSVEGSSPQEGAGMVFISLPAVFNSAFGSQPVLCWLIQTSFYFILFVAAITSAMFLYEVATAFISERQGISRKKAAIIISVSSFVIGSVSSLSMGTWDFIKIMDMNLIDFIDATTSKVVLPLTGLGAALFVGWRMKQADVLDEVTNGGMLKFALMTPMIILLRYIVPLLIITLMVYNFL